MTIAADVGASCGAGERFDADLDDHRHGDWQRPAMLSRQELTFARLTRAKLAMTVATAPALLVAMPAGERQWQTSQRLIHTDLKLMTSLGQRRRTRNTIRIKEWSHRHRSSGHPSHQEPVGRVFICSLGDSLTPNPKPIGHSRPQLVAHRPTFPQHYVVTFVRAVATVNQKSALK
jgi:hypothetical protein